MVCRPVCSRVFTLIELLVVVAIIGILFSILLPCLHGSREKAQSSVCLSQLKQLGVVSLLYSTDQNAYTPPCWQRNESDTWFNTPWNMGALKSYFSGSPHEKSLVCPSGDIDGVTMNVGITPRDYAMNGFNWWITGNANAGIAWALKNSNGDTKGEPLKLIEIDNPQGLVYFGDKKREAAGQQSTSGAAINGKSDTGPGNVVYNRHFKGNNFVFVDGHASRLTQSGYFTDSIWTINPND